MKESKFWKDHKTKQALAKRLNQTALLSRCPFCGKRPELVFTQPWWVDCQNHRCAASGPSRSTATRAIKAWNNQGVWAPSCD